MFLRFHTHRSSHSRILNSIISVIFLLTSVLIPATAETQTLNFQNLNLPAPGSMVTASQPYVPTLIEGITINPNNPLQYDFIIDTGDSGLTGEALASETNRLVRYFLSALTIPEEELWVNLSPYENDQMISPAFGLTEMGRDLLAQDYMLKQLSASMMYPEGELGKSFWNKAYSKAKELFGTTDVSLNTFNKVWIIPEVALIHEQGNTAYIVETRLKIMLDEDYLAMANNMQSSKFGTDTMQKENVEKINSISSDVVREVLLPEIEKEVNEGKNFAPLRQMANSMVLATWYKSRLKDSLLGRVYVDQKKVRGVAQEDSSANDIIYDQYVSAFQEGVFDYIKEDFDLSSNEPVLRKYFSGGAIMDFRRSQQVLKDPIYTLPQSVQRQIEDAKGPSSSRSKVVVARYNFATATAVNSPNFTEGVKRLMGISRDGIAPTSGISVRVGGVDKAMLVQGNLNPKSIQTAQALGIKPDVQRVRIDETLGAVAVSIGDTFIVPPRVVTLLNEVSEPVIRMRTASGNLTRRTELSLGDGVTKNIQVNAPEGMDVQPLVREINAAGFNLSRLDKIVVTDEIHGTEVGMIDSGQEIYVTPNMVSNPQRIANVNVVSLSQSNPSRLAEVKMRVKTVSGEDIQVNVVGSMSPQAITALSAIEEIRSGDQIVVNPQTSSPIVRKDNTVHVSSQVAMALQELGEIKNISVDIEAADLQTPGHSVRLRVAGVSRDVELRNVEPFAAQQIISALEAVGNDTSSIRRIDVSEGLEGSDAVFLDNKTGLRVSINAAQNIALLKSEPVVSIDTSSAGTGRRAYRQAVVNNGRLSKFEVRGLSQAGLEQAAKMFNINGIEEVSVDSGTADNVQYDNSLKLTLSSASDLNLLGSQRRVSVNENVPQLKQSPRVETILLNDGSTKKVKVYASRSTNTSDVAQSLVNKGVDLSLVESIVVAPGIEGAGIAVLDGGKQIRVNSNISSNESLIQAAQVVHLTTPSEQTKQSGVPVTLRNNSGRTINVKATGEISPEGIARLAHIQRIDDGDHIVVSSVNGFVKSGKTLQISSAVASALNNLGRSEIVTIETNPELKESPINTVTLSIAGQSRQTQLRGLNAAQAQQIVSSLNDLGYSTDNVKKVEVGNMSNAGLALINDGSIIQVSPDVIASPGRLAQTRIVSFSKEMDYQSTGSVPAKIITNQGEATVNLQGAISPLVAQTAVKILGFDSLNTFEVDNGTNAELVEISGLAKLSPNIVKNLARVSEPVVRMKGFEGKSTRQAEVSIGEGVMKRVDINGPADIDIRPFVQTLIDTGYNLSDLNRVVVTDDLEGAEVGLIDSGREIYVSSKFASNPKRIAEVNVVNLPQSEVSDSAGVQMRAKTASGKVILVNVVGSMTPQSLTALSAIEDIQSGDQIVVSPQINRAIVRKDNTVHVSPQAAAALQELGKVNKVSFDPSSSQLQQSVQSVELNLNGRTKSIAVRGMTGLQAQDVVDALSRNQVDLSHVTELSASDTVKGTDVVMAEGSEQIFVSTQFRDNASNPALGGPNSVVKPVVIQRLASRSSVAPTRSALGEVNPGGIDFNPKLLDLQIKRDGDGVPLPISDQSLEDLNIEGFVPILQNISPVSSVPPAMPLLSNQPNLNQEKQSLQEFSALVD